MEYSGEDSPFYHVAAAVLLLSVASATIGCGKGDRVPTYPASGKVQLPDGSPLPGGTIIFESTDQPISARGVIELDGSFELGTYEKDDGAVEGAHRVAILADPPMNVDPDETEVEELIHPRYAHMEESGLEYTVRSKAPNDFRITVQRP